MVLLLWREEPRFELTKCKDCWVYITLKYFLSAADLNNIEISAIKSVSVYCWTISLHCWWFQLNILVFSWQYDLFGSSDVRFNILSYLRIGKGHHPSQAVGFWSQSGFIQSDFPLEHFVSVGRCQLAKILYFSWSLRSKVLQICECFS